MNFNCIKMLILHIFIQNTPLKFYSSLLYIEKTCFLQKKKLSITEIFKIKLNFNSIKYLIGNFNDFPSDTFIY